MKEKHLSNVASVLERLDKTFNKTKGKSSISFKELKEAKDKAFMKFHNGKNQIALLIPNGQEDPFFEWGYHDHLQEVAYYSVPCDKFNKNEKCIICDLVDTLKQDWEKNKHLWIPIQQKIEIYAPVINLESERTIEEGPKWVKLSKTIMDQIIVWLKGLEAGEFPPYDEEEPQKIIIHYDEDAVPKDKYKLDKKNMKPFSASQLSEWKESIQPVTNYMFSKSQEEIKKIVDEYLQRIEDMVTEAENDPDDKTKRIKDEKEEKKHIKDDSDKDDSDDLDEIFKSTNRSSGLSHLKR